jgi:hypothetical protein
VGRVVSGQDSNASSAPKPGLREPCGGSTRYGWAGQGRRKRRRQHQAACDTGCASPRILVLEILAIGLAVLVVLHLAGSGLGALYQ